MPTRPAAVFQTYRLGAGPQVWWRMVSPNGRSLATSAAALDTVEAAQRHILGIVARRADLEACVRVTPAHRWRWQLSLDSTVVVRGATEQDRRVRCDAAWRWFIEIAEIAEIEPTVHVFTRGMPVSTFAAPGAR